MRKMARNTLNHGYKSICLVNVFVSAKSSVNDNKGINVAVLPH